MYIPAFHCDWDSIILVFLVLLEGETTPEGEDWPTAWPILMGLGEVSPMSRLSSSLNSRWKYVLCKVLNKAYLMRKIAIHTILQIVYGK